MIALLGLGGLGGLGLTAFFSARRLVRLDRITAFLAWGPLFVSVSALALAHAGWFRLPLLIGLALAWGLGGLVALALNSRKQKEPPLEEDESRHPPFLAGLALLVLAAGLLASPAHKYLLGGWDPGEYVCTASNIARTEALAIRDPLLPELSRAERTVLMHEPKPPRRTLQAGYLVKDAAKGELMPDYYHLYPSWLAVWVRIFGLDGAWPGHTAISLFAFAMVVAAASRLFGVRTGLLAGLVLLLGPLQLYLMRFTTAETLTQFCLFTGFWALDRAFKRAGGGFLFTAGAAFGVSILAHSTSVLPVAGVLLYLGIRALRERTFRGWGIPAWVAACAGGAMVWNAIRAEVVTRFVWDGMAGHPERWGLAAALGLVVLAGGLLAGKTRMGSSPAAMRVMRWMPFLFVAGLALAGYFIRPHFQRGPEALNLVFFGRMAGGMGLILAVCFFALRGRATWTEGQRAFLAAGLLTCAVLLVNKMAQPLYLWAGRRWVPMVLPFVTILAAEAAVFLILPSAAVKRRAWKAASLLAGLAAVLIWLPALARTGRPVRQVREYETMPGQMKALAGLVREADIVLCSHWEPATPLRYAFGIPAWSLSRLSGPGGLRDARIATALLRRWAAEGRRVYWIGDRFFDRGFSLSEAGEAGGVFTVLERRPDRIPRAAVPEKRRYRVYRVEPPVAVAGQGPECVDIGHSAMGLTAGFSGWERERDPATFSYIGYRSTRGTGRLMLPALPGAWRIRLKGPPEAADGWPVAVKAEGRVVGEIQATPRWETFAFELPAGLGTNGVVELEIDSPHASRGKKRFGVAVDWLTRGE